MNTRDVGRKSFEFGWALMIWLIKLHMSNRISIGGLSSNLEESIRVHLDQAREVDPPPPNVDKARVCIVFQKKSRSQITKKRLTLGRKSKRAELNLAIIYVGSISLACVEHALKTSKTTT